MGAQSRAIAASLTKQIETAAKALVLEIVANLIRTTPVDTGWARANWIPSIGQPATDVVGSADGVSTAEQAAATAAVLAFTIDQAVMYVSNFVPYINVLNYGHSQQAPALFIEFCVDQALQTVQQKFQNLDLASHRSQFQQAVVGKIKAMHVVSAFKALR